MTIAVGVGLMEYPFQDVSAYWRWVDLCEAGGVDSLWQTDRVVSSEPILECMTTMAALAGRTRRIKFGMNVVSLALRDPVLVAKQCATIDVLSNGRLLPAFGIGSPRAPEWAALNLDTGTRGRRTDEGLQIIGRLWREDKVDFAGVHYRLTGASIAPKPVQAELPDLDRRVIAGGDPAHRALRHRLAGGPRDASRSRRHRRGHPHSQQATGTRDRGGSLWRRLPILFRAGRRTGRTTDDGGLPAAHRAGSGILLRRRRCRHHRRAHRRVRRRWHIEVRTAPARRRRRRGHRPDAATDCRGPAAGRFALAKAAESGAAVIGPSPAFLGARFSQCRRR